MTKFPDFRKFAKDVDKQLAASATLLPPAGEIAKLGPDMDENEANEMLTLLCDVEVAPELKAMLMLPQELQVYWQEGPAMGELFLCNTSGIDSRRVDVSQRELEFFGAPLSDYRIVDEVANIGGPFFTLVRREGNRLAEQLYFFDSRECWKLELAVADYIELAFKTFAPLYWQCLFIDAPLRQSRHEKLEQTLKYLDGKAVQEALDRLSQALRAKR